MLLHATDCCHIHHGSYPDYLLLDVAVKKSCMLVTTKDKKIHLSSQPEMQAKRGFPIGMFFYKSKSGASHFTVYNLVLLA